MNIQSNRSLRIISAVLVLLFFMPTTPLLAQGRAVRPGNMRIQPFESAPNQNRIGGSSFGTSVRKASPKPYFLEESQPEGRLMPGPTYQVHILGEVRYPGTYRVPASTRLSEAVELAGGLTERGAKRTLELRRKGAKKRRVDLLSFQLLGNLDNNPYLLDNDVVYAPLKDRVVQIAGAVKRPDIYELPSKTSLHDLIKLAGGFSPGVALSSPAKVVRWNDEHKKIIDINLNNRETSRFYVSNADVVVIPHLLTRDKEFDYNIPNLPGDSGLFYPSFEERVFVIGAVYKPGPYAYSPYYSVREYLTQAGGFTKFAKHKKMTVLTSTGETKKADHKTAINPGDTIVIPERYLRPENWLTLVLGISSTALGITTTILTLTR